MKNLIKSRRGIAIEMAIGAMFIMIALSIILFSISGMQRKHKESDRDAFNKKVEVYRVLDEIEKALQNTDKAPFANDTSIEVTINETKTEYTVISLGNNTYEVSKDGNQILTFTVENNTITSWRD